MSLSDIITAVAGIVALGLAIFLHWDSIFPLGSNQPYNPWDEDGNLKQ